MLPSAIPNARILRFGYDAKWWGEGSVRARIPDLANKLLRGILNEPERKVSIPAMCKHTVQPTLTVLETSYANPHIYLPLLRGLDC